MDYLYYFWLLSYLTTTVTIIAIFAMKVSKLMKKPTNLEGKHVLITGGSSGIGRSIAIEAAKLGADITIIARDEVKLQAAVSDVQKACIRPSQRVEYVKLDVSKSYGYVEKKLGSIEDDMGPVYMLINCVGTAIGGTLEDMSIEDVNYLINTNFLSIIHTTKALVGRMKARGDGHIVITGSQAALMGIYGFSIYSGTKFALRGLAESLYMEVKTYGINVTLALPPDTDTPGFANEEKTKPMETKLISETGGLYSPDVVGARILKDALEKKFFSTIGFESFFVTTVSSGMSPATSIGELLIQSFLMGPFRLVSYYYQKLFIRLIKECMEVSSDKKDE